MSRRTLLGREDACGPGRRRGEVSSPIPRMWGCVSRPQDRMLDRTTGGYGAVDVHGRESLRIDSTSGPRRRLATRLGSYDYAQAGAYFVTICTHERECLLGQVAGDEVTLSPLGRIADQVWYDVPPHFGNVEVDVFVVMPNHVHAIVIISADTREAVQRNETAKGAETAPLQRFAPATTDLGNEADGSIKQAKGVGTTQRRWTLGHVVAFYKYQTTKLVNEIRGSAGTRFWQRNYYERVVRNERELDAIRQYIVNNPLNWELDAENSARAR